MSKLSIVSAARMSKILRHLDGRATVVPIHKGEDLGRGLIRAILQDVDLSPEEFEKIRREI